MKSALMSSDKPTLEQITKVLRRLDIAHGWIGEGDEIVRELLDYIDGKNTEIADWALKLCPECGCTPEHSDWCKSKPRT